MPKLLHIISSPRGGESRSLKFSNAYLQHLRSTQPEWSVSELDLSTEDLPPLTVVRISGKYALLGGGELNDEHKAAWEAIERYINQFLSADAYLISAPMWNFGVPYLLKHYIDLIVQPKYLFQYTADGPEGLVKGKKMIVATARGGDYSAGSPAAAMDQHEPYLRTVFGFCGITDMDFVYAQPCDAAGPDVAQQKVDEAIETIKKITL